MAELQFKKTTTTTKYNCLKQEIDQVKAPFVTSTSHRNLRQPMPCTHGLHIATRPAGMYEKGAKLLPHF